MSKFREDWGSTVVLGYTQHTHTHAQASKAKSTFEVSKINLNYVEIILKIKKNNIN